MKKKFVRSDGRGSADSRAVRITRQYQRHAEGSVLIEVGDTRVICSATVEGRVPPWMREAKHGWVTAEYGMLPRSSGSRISRESRGSVRGRTHEIQRLVGRSLRAVTDLDALGQRTITLDCDVIQADGGTRTASVTGAFVALHDALSSLVDSGALPKLPLRDFVAATSIGIVGGEVLLDLCYEEDSGADVDMNLVMTRAGLLIEVQGTAERAPFSSAKLAEMLRVGRAGIDTLIRAQEASLGIRHKG
ncbi:MAG: ribonuclease PH [bacterium]